VTEDDLQRGDLAAFLREHAAAIAEQDEDLPLFRAGVSSRRKVKQLETTPS
jgi:hypothetical protein